MSKPKEFIIGSKGETLVSEIFNRHGLTCNKPKVFNRFHDLIFAHDKTDYTIEVKYDVMGARTGNIALEFWNSKAEKPSGIVASQATLWAHIFDGGVYIVSVLDLRVFLQNNKPLRIIFSGGDNNANLYLYKAADILKSVFVRIDLLNKKQFLDVVKKCLRK